MEPIDFVTEDGIHLEGELRLPDGPPRGSAVLCHPHPRQGGSKDHPLLWAIRNHLAAARGFAVLGFNFRGVMGSGGVYGGGRAELGDVRAAIGAVLARADGPTVLVGWSFGANVALREALDDERPEALALVGLPLEPGDLTLPPLPAAAELHTFRRPTLLLAGEHDSFCPSDRLRELGASFPNATVEIVAGTDHYFWRREREAAAIVGELAERLVG